MSSRTEKQMKAVKNSKETAERRKEGIVRRVQVDFEATLARCVQGNEPNKTETIRAWGAHLASRCNQLSQDRDDQPGLLSDIGNIVNTISAGICREQPSTPITVRECGQVDYKIVLSDLLRVQGLLSSITASYCTRTQKGTIPAVNKTGFGGKNGQPATKLMAMFGLEPRTFQERYPQIWKDYGQQLKGKSMPVDWTPLFVNIQADLTASVCSRDTVPPLRSPSLLSRPSPLDHNELPPSKRARTGNCSNVSSFKSQQFHPQQQQQQQQQQLYQQQLQQQLQHHQQQLSMHKMDVDISPLRSVPTAKNNNNNNNNYYSSQNITTIQNVQTSNLQPTNVPILFNNASINTTQKLSSGIGPFVTPQTNYPSMYSQYNGVNSFNPNLYEYVENNCSNPNSLINNNNNVGFNETNTNTANLSSLSSVGSLSFNYSGGIPSIPPILSPTEPRCDFLGDLSSISN